jgi:hypothetical protein
MPPEAMKAWAQGVIDRRLKAAGEGSNRSEVIKEFASEIKRTVYGLGTGDSSTSALDKYLGDNKELFDHVLTVHPTHIGDLMKTLVKECIKQGRVSATSSVAPSAASRPEPTQ